MPTASEVTQLLLRARDGGSAARDDLLRILYDELRRIAGIHLQKERAGHTLQPTALVHELYLRLLKKAELPGESRAEFVAFAAQAMRRILVDHARKHRRLKRGGEWQKVPMDEGWSVVVAPDVDLLDLNEALERLAQLDPRKARIVELRTFGGLTGDETARALGVSPVTVDRDWKVAKVWLLGELRKDD